MHVVYFLDAIHHNLYVIDGQTNKVLKRLSITDGTGLAVDSVMHAVYVSGGTNLTVLDGKTQTVMATVPIAQSASCVAVDEVTHQAYVGGGDTDRFSNQTPGTVSVVAWRPDVLEERLRQ